MTDLYCLQFKKLLKLCFVSFLQKKLSPELEYLLKNGPKTVLLKLFVFLMMIGTTTALPDEGEI